VRSFGEKASDVKDYLPAWCRLATKGTVIDVQVFQFVMTWSVIHAHWLSRKSNWTRLARICRKNSVLFEGSDF